MHSCVLTRTPLPTQTPNSQLPYMEDTGIQKRRTDVWTSNAEFLHLSAGDFEEHAHLLAGYFMQLGLQVGRGGGVRAHPLHRHLSCWCWAALSPSQAHTQLDCLCRSTSAHAPYPLDTSQDFYDVHSSSCTGNGLLLL